MAYLIFSSSGDEIDRRELTEATIVGRAMDCNVSVRDILLSRHHCKLEKVSQGWAISDLGSKNGTRLNNEVLAADSSEPYVLKDGDIIAAGRTIITFKTGKFVPGVKKALPPRQRPSDPNEALAGTVAGFKFVEPATAAATPQARPATPAQRIVPRPRPNPKPADPAAFAREDIYSMLNQIASSSWDSIHATNSQPLRNQRPQPRPILDAKGAKVMRQRSPVSLDLQLTQNAAAATAAPVMTDLLQHTPQGPTRLQIFAKQAGAWMANARRWVTKAALIRIFD